MFKLKKKKIIKSFNSHVNPFFFSRLFLRLELVMIVLLIERDDHWLDVSKRFLSQSYEVDNWRTVQMLCWRLPLSSIASFVAFIFKPNAT